MTDKTPPVRYYARQAKLPKGVGLLLREIDGHKNHVMFASAENAAAWMDMSLSTFYRVRGKALELDLIEVEERPGQTSIYRVKKDVLTAYAEEHPAIKPKALPAGGLVKTARGEGLVEMTRGVYSERVEGSSQNDQGGLVKTTRQRVTEDSPQESPKSLVAPSDVEASEEEAVTNEVASCDRHASPKFCEMFPDSCQTPKILV